MTELTLQKSTAKRLYSESPDWFRKVLTESFGEELFEKRSYEQIKTFEDACEELGIDIDKLDFSNDTTDESAYKKLKIIIAAINQGWTPDWSNTNQRKWWPWFNLSSGFGFSYSYFGYGYAAASVGSRLCFETEEKCVYAAKQFIEIYEQFITIKK